MTPCPRVGNTKKGFTSRTGRNLSASPAATRAVRAAQPAVYRRPLVPKKKREEKHCNSAASSLRGRGKLSVERRERKKKVQVCSQLGSHSSAPTSAAQPGD